MRHPSKWVTANRKYKIAGALFGFISALVTAAPARYTVTDRRELPLDARPDVALMPRLILTLGAAALRAGCGASSNPRLLGSPTSGSIACSSLTVQGVQFNGWAVDPQCSACPGHVYVGADQGSLSCSTAADLAEMVRQGGWGPFTADDGAGNVTSDG